MAILCRERYLIREEMKTQYQKAEKQQTKCVSTKTFLCPNQQKEKRISETLVKYTME